MDFLRGARTPFVKWALVNAVFAIVMIGAALSYHGKISGIGLAAIGAVLVLFVATSSYAGYLAWQGSVRDSHRQLSLAIELAPKLAMLGTVGGFLTAFSSSVGDVQHRVLGASTGLAATFVGIATMITLEILRHVIED
jgi:hypothetical protein